MQQWLAQQAAPAQWLLTSAANRAQQTSRFVNAAFGLKPAAVTIEKNLYHASPEVLLDAVRSTPADVQCMGIVAHNPGLTYLISELLAPEQALANLPTFGCALFQCETDDWLEVAAHNARLVSLTSPKQLEQPG